MTITSDSPEVQKRKLLFNLSSRKRARATLLIHCVNGEAWGTALLTALAIVKTCEVSTVAPRRGGAVLTEQGRQVLTISDAGVAILKATYGLQVRRNRSAILLDKNNDPKLNTSGNPIGARLLFTTAGPGVFSTIDDYVIRMVRSKPSEPDGRMMWANNLKGVQRRLDTALGFLIMLADNKTSDTDRKRIKKALSLLNGTGSGITKHSEGIYKLTPVDRIECLARLETLIEDERHAFSRLLDIPTAPEEPTPEPDSTTDSDNENSDNDSNSNGVIIISTPSHVRFGHPTA